VIETEVTVKVPSATAPNASVATTVVPEVPEGTANVQANAPDESVVSAPEEQDVTDTESKTSEASVDETVKPEPLTVTCDPVGPWLGTTVIAGMVTVNVAEAVAPVASVATTLVPEVPAGTAKEHESTPVPFGVRLPEEHAEIVTLSKTSEVRGTNGEKPVPLTVTGAPCGPWPGVTVIAGTVTVNETVFDGVDVLRSFPVTGYAPADSLGTRNVQENPPLASVVIFVAVELQSVPPVAVSPMLANVTLAVALTLNPEPLTVYVAPTGPCAGATEIAGPPPKGERWVRGPGAGVEVGSEPTPARTTAARTRLTGTAQEE
jgi:hypothetical protein